MNEREFVMWLHGFASSNGGVAPRQDQWDSIVHALEHISQLPVIRYVMEKPAEVDAPAQPEPEQPGWAIEEPCAANGFNEPPLVFRDDTRPADEA